MQGVWIFLSLIATTRAQSQPNIVYVFADDLGWNDVGYHGTEIMTPNIDRLAAEGRRLENYYVQPLCSPTRGAFMTGRYPIHTCQQRSPFEPDTVGGASLNETFFVEILKEVGYSTHIVGKWHLGHSSVEYLPTYRGFDTLFGYYNGYADHFSHYRCDRENDTVCGNDLHDDVGTTLFPVTEFNGTYSTELFTQRAVDIIENHNIEQPLFLDVSYSAVHTPLQAPQECIDLYPDIEDEDRRIYAAMTTCMDNGIGNITDSLRRTGMWNNTVFIFSSDNGGASVADNGPLRDDKGTLFNGGTQVAAFITSPLLSTTGEIYYGLMHVTDWFPTLLNLAGGDFTDLELDGYDIWDSLSENTESPRTEIVHAIDPTYPLVGDNLYPDIFDVRVLSALRTGPWKIMTGGHETTDQNLWLFNLEDDPFESTDVSALYPDVVETLLGRLAAYNETTVPVCVLDSDLEGANPENFDGNWMPWIEL